MNINLNAVHVFGGLLVMLGAVGGLENDTMSFSKAMILSGIGMIYALYGVVKLDEEYQDRDE
jgi:hypothetical protein